MSQASLVFLSGIILQVACLLISLTCDMPLQSFLGDKPRRFYCVCLLWSLMTLCIPCAVATAFGFLSPMIGVWICVATSVVYAICLIGNAGNIIESCVTTIVFVWVAVFVAQRLSERFKELDQRPQKLVARVQSGRLSLRLKSVSEL